MKMQKLLTVTALSLTLLSSGAMAQTNVELNDGLNDSGKMLVYISPVEYSHPHRLTAYFNRDYWYSQGLAVEGKATKALSQQFSNVELCDGAEVGSALVWIKPDVFYNPLMRVFYGKITADVYSGTGKPIGSYIGRAEKIGFLDVAPMRSIDAVYQGALQRVTDKMKADPTLQTALSDSTDSAEPKTACATVSLLPGFKRSFMDIIN